MMIIKEKINKQTHIKKNKVKRTIIAIKSERKRDF